MKKNVYKSLNSYNKTQNRYVIYEKNNNLLVDIFTNKSRAAKAMKEMQKFFPRKLIMVQETTYHEALDV